MTENVTDYRQFSNLESYLFDTVQTRFHRQGYLSAFDFFCIIIWKANRAKSTVAKRLLRQGRSSLEDAVRELTQGLARQSTPEDRLRYLLDTESWGFRLPMATAILTVLYPEDFTIYDFRVCDSIRGFHELVDVSRFDKLWADYQQFKRKVEQLAPEGLSLRDKDRYLWGRSFHEQLVHDIEAGFRQGELPQESEG